MEPTPADPTDQPGGENTEPATGATQEPTRDPIPEPEPSNTAPADGDVEPTAMTLTSSSGTGGGLAAALAATFLIPFLGLGVRRRRTDAS